VRRANEARPFTASSYKNIQEIHGIFAMWIQEHVARARWKRFFPTPIRMDVSYKEVGMYLVWIELRHAGVDADDLVRREFSDFALARSWAVGELDANRQATGNAAIFETQGPLVRLAWETHEAVEAAKVSSRRIRPLHKAQNRRDGQILSLKCG
jgi:hypothetical protein